MYDCKSFIQQKMDKVNQLKKNCDDSFKSMKRSFYNMYSFVKTITYNTSIFKT